MGLAAHQEEIIAQLYREMYRKLVVYAENALNDSLAEEAVQDTFRIACSKYDELMYKFATLDAGSTRSN